jgi:drug/metabolite transporter (DMT)-like permease
MSAPSITSRDWALILLLSIIWGGAFYLNVLALRGFPTNSLVFGRMAIATLPLLIIISVSGQKMPRGWAAWRGLALLGVLNIVVPIILFTWAQTRIASGLASVLNATTPLWGVLAAHFLTDDEKATPLRVTGVLLGLAGVIVMTLPDMDQGMSGQTLAIAACLFSTLCFALASILARKLNIGGVTPMALTAGQLASSALIMLPIMLIVDQPWTLPMPSMESVLALVALALLSTTFAYWLFFKVLENVGASNSLLITFLIPVTAILLGVMGLGEKLSLAQCGGIALIAAGLLVMDGRILRRG